jgi:hypothetical protein
MMIAADPKERLVSKDHGGEELRARRMPQLGDRKRRRHHGAARMRGRAGMRVVLAARMHQRGIRERRGGRTDACAVVK